MAQWTLTVVSFDHSLGYHRSPMAEECRWLTSVVFPDGLYQYTVAPMGWKDSAEWMACHTSIMYDDSVVVGDDKLQKSLALYRDDGSIGTNEGGHVGLQLLRRWFECVKRHNGTISDKKSFFWIQYFHSLGFLLGNGLIIPEESKIRAVDAWRYPENQKELKGFIGFTGFFKHCVVNLQLTVSPLFYLYKKEFGTRKTFLKEWASDPRYAAAFTKAKQAVMDAAALRVIDPRRPLLLACDASLTGIASVAGHAANEADDDELTATTLYHPCAFWSRPLTDIEQRYSHPEKEALSQVYGAMEAEPYAGRKVVFLLDAKAWVLAQNESKNKRVDKWRMRLSQLPQDDGYPKILFRPGTEHLDVDPLSRLNEQARDTTTLDEIIEESVQDPVVLRAYQLVATIVRLGWKPYDDIARFLLKGELPTDPRESKSIRAQSRWYFVDVETKSLYRRAIGFGTPRKVPAADEVDQILKDYHGSPELGCHSVFGTYQLVAQRYYWNSIWDSIVDYIDRCPACIRRSKAHQPGKYKLYRIVPPATLFVLLGMDTCTLVTGTNGYKSILTLVDYTCSLIRAYPLKSNKAVPMVRNVESWCRNYGYPQWIIDDKAKYFEGAEFKQWATEKNVQMLPTAVQHPEGNGKAEKSNEIIVTFIARRLIKRNWKPNRWPDVLQDALSDALHHPSTVSGLSPFQQMYGQNARMPRDNVDFPVISTEEELLELRQKCQPMVAKLRETARLNVIESQQKSEASKGAKDVVSYSPGELVWVYDRSGENTFAADVKLKPKWELCRINEVLSRTSYTVNSAITGRPMRQDNGPVSHWRMKKAALPKAWYEHVLNIEEIDMHSPFDVDFDRDDLQPANPEETSSVDYVRVNLVSGVEDAMFQKDENGEYWIQLLNDDSRTAVPTSARCNLVQQIPSNGIGFSRTGGFMNRRESLEYGEFGSSTENTAWRRHGRL